MIDIPSDDVVFNPDNPHLELCPFCGYKPKLEYTILYGDEDGSFERPLDSYRVKCPTCGVHGQWWSERSLAVNRWNMRRGYENQVDS